MIHSVLKLINTNQLNLYGHKISKEKKINVLKIIIIVFNKTQLNMLDVYEMKPFYSLYFCYYQFIYNKNIMKKSIFQPNLLSYCKCFLC